MLILQDLTANVIVEVLGPLLSKAFDNFVDRCRQDVTLRRRLLRIAWAFSIVLMIGITIASVLISEAKTDSYRAGTLIATVLWAIFLGVSTLLFLPRTMIATIFGFAFGSTLSEASSGTGLLTSVNKAIMEISSQVSAAVIDDSTQLEKFISSMVWIFVVVFTLLCLPAFVTKERANGDVAPGN